MNELRVALQASASAAPLQRQAAVVWALTLAPQLRSRFFRRFAGAWLDGLEGVLV